LSKEATYSKFVSIYRKILSADENYGSTLKNIQEIITFTNQLLSSPAVAETFFYFCIHGAATSWILQNELQMPKTTTYRTLKRLRAMKVVVPALRVRARGKQSSGGPRPKIWSLQEVENTEVAAALKLHYNLLSPKFCVAQRIAQTILEEYRGNQLNEINYSELVIKVKAMKTPFRTPDIATLAAEYLNDQGLKVWR